MSTVKELSKEQEYAIKMVRAIKDCLTNEKNPDFIDIESEEFEVIHFLHALKDIMPNEIESFFYE